MSNNFELSGIEMSLSAVELLYEAHCAQVRRDVYRRVVTWLHKNGHKLSECKSEKKICPQIVVNAVRIAWNRGWLQGMPIKQCEVDLLRLRKRNQLPNPLRTIPNPCEALPGTQAKIDELERRYWAGEELWHDQDALLLALHFTDKVLSSVHVAHEVRLPASGLKM